jgi:hypothetical protein
MYVCCTSNFIFILEKWPKLIHKEIPNLFLFFRVGKFAMYVYNVSHFFPIWPSKPSGKKSFREKAEIFTASSSSEKLILHKIGSAGS